MSELKDIIKKGHDAYDNKNYREAIEYYNQALDIESNDVDSWINLGLSHRHLEEYDRAIECYLEATKIDPKNSLAWNNMGWAYHCKGEEDWAIDSYKKALELDPTYDRALVNLADTYNSQGEYEKTIEIFERALKLDPSNYNNWIDLGYAYRHLEEYDKAIDSYNQALKLNPEDKLAWNNIGWAYYSIEELHMAVDSYKRSLKLDWRYDLPYKNLLAAYDFAIDNESKDYILWNSFSKAFLIGKDYEKALSACNQCLLIKPNFKPALKLQEKIQDARKEFEEIKAKDDLIEETLNTFITASVKVPIKDIIEFVKFNSPDIKFKDIEIKANIIKRIEDGKLNAKIDGKEIQFLD